MIRPMSVLLAVLALSCASDSAERAAPTTPPFATSPSVSPTPSISVETAAAHFSTPTKNIGCYVSADYMSCEIFERDWPLPSRPADCEGDYGAGLNIDANGSTSFGHCASDTVMSAERILAYGTGVEVRPFRCTSETKGVTCVHVPTGKGFFLSRASYRFLP